MVWGGELKGTHCRWLYCWLFDSLLSLECHYNTVWPWAGGAGGGESLCKNRENFSLHLDYLHVGLASSVT